MPMGQIELSDIESYPHLRPVYKDIARFSEFPDMLYHLDNLAEWKKRAVKIQEDELQGKIIWCMEGLITGHSEFTLAHNSMKLGDVVDAFHRIERILHTTHYIRRHINDPSGKLGLDLIRNIAQNWVMLLDPPYGFSHGSIVKRAYCSICQTKVGIRWTCGHIKGEIYGGELCGQIIEELEIVEVSIVERPASLILSNHTQRMLNRAEKFKELAVAFPFRWSKTEAPCVAAVPAGCEASTLCPFAHDAVSLAETAPTEMWSCI